MEEEEGEECSSPFWLKSSTSRRRFSSIFLNSGLLIFLLCLTAVLSIFIVVPWIGSFTNQILRPTVKQGWDYVNIVLLLLAFVFGFLSRNRNRDRDVSSPAGVRSEIQKSNPSTPRQQWYEYTDRTVYSSFSSAAVDGAGLRRNSCSYPDLRDASPWINADDGRWRFSDDLVVEAHRYSDSDQFRRQSSWKRVFEEEEEEQQQQQQEAAPLTRAEEDSYTLPPPSAPAPPQPTALHRKPNGAYESVAHREQLKGSEQTKTLAPPAATTPPTPSPPVDSEKKSSKSVRKRSEVNATKDLFTSIHNDKNNKKKKRRQKSVENVETLIQPHAPSPPPSPPRPSTLHNLFSSQKGKSKKIITVPPPSTTARASKSTAIIPLRSSDIVRPVENANLGGESPLSGCESPLIPIPPPPPPPPFKMPSWKFLVRGDYVKVGSMDISRSVSPDDTPASTPTAARGGGAEVAAAGQLFCSSPDVDTKADMFIAKFRAGLKLQKMDSMIRQRGLGLSNLGPDAKPGSGPG